jgi:5-methylcytosine-specific restriction endonuclease McrA
VATYKYCASGHGYYQARSCPDCERERNRRPRRRARGTSAWKQARAEAKGRDDFRCRRCGLTNRRAKLEVHHIDGNSQNHALDNLITLCDFCHAKVGRGAASGRGKAARPPLPSFSRETPRGEEPEEK